MEIKILKNGYNITEYTTSITWSGSASQCCREVSFEVIYNNEDASFKNISIELGAVIKFYVDKKLKFVGTVTSRTCSGQKGTATYIAKDYMVHLLRSEGSYIFRNTTAEKITKAVCNDLQIDTKKLPETKVNLKKTIYLGNSYYQMILIAYTKAAKKTGKKYQIEMAGSKLTVIKKGINTGVVLTALLSSEYSENLDSMVNKVVIYSSKGKKLGEVKDDDSIKKYGIYQGNLEKEKGTNAKTEAKNMLEGIAKEASVEAIGDIRCVSGRALKIKDKATGLTGTYWIENDSHIFSNGQHSMSLTLAFKNVMEEVSEEEGMIEKKSSSSSSSSSNYAYAGSGASDMGNKIVQWCMNQVGKSGFQYDNGTWATSTKHCEMFAERAYRVNELPVPRKVSARAAQNAWMISHDKNPPIGAALFYQTTHQYGHVGIYAGNNTSVEGGNATVVIRKGEAFRSSYLGWGYMGGLQNKKYFE